MTIDQTGINKLQALGYSALQAGFLWLVALHSGVFLRRQYLQFAGISSGKHATEFLKKLVESRHCRTFPLAGRIAFTKTCQPKSTGQRRARPKPSAISWTSFRCFSPPPTWFTSVS